MKIEHSDKVPTSHVGHVAWLVLAALLGSLLGYVIGTEWQNAKNLEDNVTPVSTKSTPTAASTTTSSTSTSPTATTTATTANPTAGWLTYTNTTYGYSIKYPSTIVLTSATGSGFSEDHVAPTSAGLQMRISTANDGDYICTVIVAGMSTLNESSIKQELGATLANNIVVTSVTVGGKNGYKATVNLASSYTSSDFYFVQNTAGKVLKLTMEKSNSTADNILSSFHLN